VAPVSLKLDGVANDGEAGEGDNLGSDLESLYGGGGDDVVKGSPAPESLHGEAGEDIISGLGGDDSLYGGRDDDALFGDGDDDRFEGSRFPDGADVMYGGSGLDHANYRLRMDTVIVDLGGVADDGAPGESDNVRADIEEVTGSRDSDVLTGSDLAHNTLRGSGGDDTLSGLGGDDWLIGYAGADTLLGGDDDDKLSGADNVAGNDSLDGNVGSDECDSDTGDTETGCES
jgi:Ca2+-binding RTX toxin-like protein